MFPTNTNILFADIEAVEKASEKTPFPGVLVNMKKKITITDSSGKERSLPAGRLESTMQNISDSFVMQSDHPLSDDEVREQPVYLTYQSRKKTISVTKNLYQGEGSIQETCDGAFLDLLSNHRDLFVSHCQWEAPPLPSEKEYLEHGPSFIIDYHPALGPLYAIIGQKIRCGRLAYGGECVFDIAEFDCEQLEVKGVCAFWLLTL